VVMKKMDSCKGKVIKSGEIIFTGQSVPIGGIGKKTAAPDAPKTRTIPGTAKSQPAPAKTSRPAEADAASIRQEAYAKGYADGQKAQHKEVAGQLEALAAVMRAVPRMKKDMMEKAEKQMVRLAIAVAEKILQQQVSARPDVILGVLKGALKNLSETDGMKIRLHPEDFRYMMEVKKEFVQTFDGIRHMVFEEDAGVKRGGAVVETQLGEVDARLENQLKEIAAALLSGE